MINLSSILFVFIQFVFITKVSGSDASPNKIVIEYNVTIKDHPLLANDSKHWVGAGMRSGYQMLWVGQEALYVYKVCITSLCQTTNSPYMSPYSNIDIIACCELYFCVL